MKAAIVDGNETKEYISRVGVEKKISIAGTEESEIEKWLAGNKMIYCVSFASLFPIKQCSINQVRYPAVCDACTMECKPAPTTAEEAEIKPRRKPVESKSYAKQSSRALPKTRGTDPGTESHKLRQMNVTDMNQTSVVQVISQTPSGKAEAAHNAGKPTFSEEIPETEPSRILSIKGVSPVVDKQVSGNGGRSNNACTATKTNSTSRTATGSAIDPQRNANSPEQRRAKTKSRKTKPRKCKFTAKMDRLLREVYLTTTGGGEVGKLARELGLPRWKVSRRAREIGAYEPRVKEPVWSDPELKLLKEHAHKTPETIQRILKKNGFSRSVTGILLKRKRTSLLKDLAGESATAIARHFGVDTKCVVNWIQKGWLEAERRGTKRVAMQGGDMYFIMKDKVRRFIIENIDLIDIRKVDKAWLILTLANDRQPAVS